MTNIPSVALPKDGLTGTPFNWLGRSSYASDAYLSQSYIYDFRLYSETISVEDITSLAGVVENLNTAYSTPTSIDQMSISAIRVVSTQAGVISVTGDVAGHSVKVYDLTGRKIVETTALTIEVDAGIYLVKVGASVTKVIVE